MQILRNVETFSNEDKIDSMKKIANEVVRIYGPDSLILAPVLLNWSMGYHSIGK